MGFPNLDHLLKYWLNVWKTGPGSMALVLYVVHIHFSLFAKIRSQWKTEIKTCFLSQHDRGKPKEQVQLLTLKALFYERLWLNTMVKIDIFTYVLCYENCSGSTQLAPTNAGQIHLVHLKFTSIHLLTEKLSKHSWSIKHENEDQCLLDIQESSVEHYKCEVKLLLKWLLSSSSLAIFWIWHLFH